MFLVGPSALQCSHFNCYALGGGEEPSCIVFGWSKFRTRFSGHRVSRLGFDGKHWTKQSLLPTIWGKDWRSSFKLHSNWSSDVEYLLVGKLEMGSRSLRLYELWGWKRGLFWPCLVCFFHFKGLKATPCFGLCLVCSFHIELEALWIVGLKARLDLALSSMLLSF